MGRIEDDALRAQAMVVLAPMEKTRHQCHSASLALVKAGLATRVARGACTGVGGQHSWAVDGDDCYDQDARIIDPTMWSYQDEELPYIWIGKLADGLHTPHGSGSIWKWGRPPSCHRDCAVRLEGQDELSEAAQVFLDLLGHLDRVGWGILANSPVGEWPAGEIFGAMADTPGLSQLLPIDILGMNTNRNPQGLYLREEGTQPHG